MYAKIMVLIWGVLTVLNINALYKAIALKNQDDIVFWGIFTIVGIGFLAYRGYQICQDMR